jgi:hypothetical protein
VRLYSAAIGLDFLKIRGAVLDLGDRSDHCVSSSLYEALKLSLGFLTHETSSPAVLWLMIWNLK